MQDIITNMMYVPVERKESHSRSIDFGFDNGPRCHGGAFVVGIVGKGPAKGTHVVPGGLTACQGKEVGMEIEH
jgi:hypothetical protein